MWEKSQGSKDCWDRNSVASRPRKGRNKSLLPLPLSSPFMWRNAAPSLFTLLQEHIALSPLPFVVELLLALVNLSYREPFNQQKTPFMTLHWVDKNFRKRLQFKGRKLQLVGVRERVKLLFKAFSSPVLSFYFFPFSVILSFLFSLSFSPSTSKSCKPKKPESEKWDRNSSREVKRSDWWLFSSSREEKNDQRIGKRRLRREEIVDFFHSLVSNLHFFSLSLYDLRQDLFLSLQWFPSSVRARGTWWTIKCGRKVTEIQSQSEKKEDGEKQGASSTSTIAL